MIAWYLVLFGIGLGFMPMTCVLCRGFKDGGWMVSKTIGIFLAASVFFSLNILHIFTFVMRNCWLVTIALFAVNVVIFFKCNLSRIINKLDIPLILVEEAIFTVTIMVWLRIISIHPEAQGTEKFMDYGFMTTMTRALYMPFEDMWYSGEPINYYYGGQFVATWLVKMSGISVGVGYNAMRATIASFSFMLPFSLGYQIMADKFTKSKVIPYLSAILSGTAVAYSSNMHFVVYGIVIKGLLGLDDDRYWIPDATRYIGYNPDLPDKTIHEFPAYSTLLGDLHAHYINILFVVTIITVAYAYGRRKLGMTEEMVEGDRGILSLKIKGLITAKEAKPKKEHIWNRFPGWLKEGIGQPEIWLIGIFTGLFRWTNYWDFPIYVVVCGSIVFFSNLRAAEYKWKRFLPPMAVQTILVLAVGYIAALPFTSTFKMISSEIHPTHSHTVFYQFMVLWGLPIFAVALFSGVLIFRFVAERRKWAAGDQVQKYVMDYPDMAILLLGLCGVGLAFMPEFIYVKDIYEGAYYRANTMFKLAYQAFIILGIVMSYVFLRLIVSGRKVTKALAAVGLALLVLTSGYTPYGTKDWFGNIFDPTNYVSRDASVFVGRNFPEDFGGIKYLNSNVKRPCVVLEAPGDSYSGYERVSVATGLATIEGWYVHEWLWRNDTDALNQRALDIEMIYTSDDAGSVTDLIEKYKVAYIYVGMLERERYTSINDVTLKQIGEVVYSDENTYIVKTFI